MRRSLPDIAIARPITIIMIMITFVVLGAISLSRLNVEFLPKVDLPFLGVFIAYPGATPAQVEQEIAILAEGEFRTLPNLERLMSNSSEGGCFVSMHFNWGTEMSQAQAEVRDRIERLRLEMPEGVSRIYIRHFSSDSVPVMEVGLSRPGDFEEFAYQVKTELLPKLQRLEGVAEVQAWGADNEQVRIEFDQNALRRTNLSLYQAIQTLQSASVNVSIGQLRDGQTEYLVRAAREFTHPDQLKAVLVAPGVRLEDVAEVSFSPPEQRFEYALDGSKQIFMIVTKESEANTVATCARVMEEFDRVLAQPNFEGTRKFVFFNQATSITATLDGLKNAGQFGGIMSVAVLFLFLRRFRPTVVVALAIPGSLMAGVIFMYFAGMSLNLVTMMALIIAVGMVVDNAIVVAENIYRYRAQGYTPRESARRGANEVGLAITSATLTTAVVFVPVFYMESGQMNVFMRQFALPVTVALGASLALALTIIPLALSRFGAEQRTLIERVFYRDGRGPRVRRFRPIHWMFIGYLAVLSGGVRHRLPALIAIVLIVYVTARYPMRQVGLQNIPQVDSRQVEVGIELDPNYDLDMTRALFRDVEGEINKRREELGIRNVFTNFDARGGEIEVFLTPLDEIGESTSPYSSREVMLILSELFPDQFPGGEIRLSTGSESVGAGGGGGGGSSVSLRLQGNDLEELDVYAERVMAAMRALPSITEVDKDTRPPDQELRIDPDEDIAVRAGIPVSLIAQTVSFALLGTRLPEMKYAGREVEVWAQFSEEDRRSRGNLDNVMLEAADGTLMPLHHMVDYDKAESPKNISRMDGKNHVWLRGKSTSENMSIVREDLTRLIESIELPTGYTLSFGDELINLERDMNSFVSTLFLAVILIYLVMAALFESWLLPLSILTTVPLAFVGVFWLMFWTGTSLDTVAFIGCILMVGVVVNNGIVIVDHINNLRRQGMPRFEAIMQAGRDRLRPVLMTAITTILGALPLALGGSAGGATITSLGRALIGGLTTGTFLTLFVVPLFYSLIDDLQLGVRSFLTSLRAVGASDRI